MKDQLGLYAETLGAYMEGKLPKGEMSLMDKVVKEDCQIGSILNEVRSTKVNWNDDIRSDYPEFDKQFSLPPIPETTTDKKPSIGIAGLAPNE